MLILSILLPHSPLVYPLIYEVPILEHLTTPPIVPNLIIHTGYSYRVHTGVIIYEIAYGNANKFTCPVPVTLMKES